MLWSTLVTILVACAAMALERAIALYRPMALRWVWAAAALASVVFAGIRLVPHRTPSVAPAAQTSTPREGAGADAGAIGGRTSGTIARSPSVWSLRERIPRVELPTFSRSTDSALSLAWVWGSALFAALLLAAAWRLHREREEWTRASVAGTSLLLSPNFGPAIVGVLHQEIVVPRWVTELDEPSRRAIVAHEEEHLRAQDPALLLSGLVMMVALPWNIGLWLCWRGLRRTIELDCDARVLARGMERGDYANVLLGAWQRARSSLLPSAAFAERASGLGKRVEHLMRPEPRRRTMRMFVGVGAAAAFVLAAFVTPSAGQDPGAPAGPYPLVIIDGVKKPDMPPLIRYTGPIVAETTTTPKFRVTYKGPYVFDTVAQKLYPRHDDIAEVQQIDPPAAEVHFGPAAKYGALLYYTKQYRAAGGAILFAGEGNRSEPAAAPGTPPDVMAQRVLDRMFNGISLPADKKSAALAIILKERVAQNGIGPGPPLATWPRRMKLQDERDLSLRTLLTNEEDRAKFDVHVAEQPHATVTAESAADNMFINLFVYDTITLNEQSKLKAHEIIRRSLIEELALYDRAPGDFDGRVAIRQKRDAELRGLLTSDRDRAKFDVRAKRTMDMGLRRP
jgi:beta-lactamase regulating signal transducer with metallopeptidase domain